MLIKSLQLLNFRNYAKLDLEFETQPTIFVGSNGAGKSNILEAIYLLSTTKSPRVEEEIELIQKGKEAATIKSILTDKTGSNELMMTLIGDSSGGTNSEIKRFGKRMAVNGVNRRVIDFIGNLPAVIFWPTDINMITGAPALRRWHLDLALAQTHRAYQDGGIPYKKALTLYEQILINRNRVLKRINEGEAKPDELTYWTDELIKYAEIVSQKRIEYFEFINNLNNPLGSFRYEYKQSILSAERLQQYKDREAAAKSTLIGPHRDDFKIKDETDRDLSKFGSRGEQRMATLAFKLAQLEFMSDILGERPVLLLDDVFSELDANHRAVVAEISLKQQTVISTVELENIPQEFLNNSHIIQMNEGQIV